MPQKKRQRPPVNFTTKRRMRLQRLQLRAKEKGLPLPAVIERLLPHTVTRQGERAGLTIPQGKREHPHTRLQRFSNTPMRNGGQQRFRIRMPPPLLPLEPCPLNLAPDFEVVINLPVKNDHKPATRREHRLVSSRGQIKNRQASMSKRNTNLRISPNTGIVWPPRGNRQRHALGEIFKLGERLMRCI